MRSDLAPPTFSSSTREGGNIMASELKSDWSPSSDLFFKVILRDFNPDMVTAWQDPKVFGDSKFAELVEVGVPRGKCLNYDLLIKIPSDLQW